jgi:hypothetical protein
MFVGSRFSVLLSYQWWVQQWRYALGLSERAESGSGTLAWSPRRYLARISRASPMPTPRGQTG